MAKGTQKKAEKAPKTHKTTIKDVIYALFDEKGVQNVKNEECLKAAQGVKPDTLWKPSHLAYWRNRYRQDELAGAKEGSRVKDKGTKGVKKAKRVKDLKKASKKLKVKKAEQEAEEAAEAASDEDTDEEAVE